MNVHKTASFPPKPDLPSGTAAWFYNCKSYFSSFSSSYVTLLSSLSLLLPSRTTSPPRFSCHCLSSTRLRPTSPLPSLSIPLTPRALSFNFALFLCLSCIRDLQVSASSAWLNTETAELSMGRGEEEEGGGGGGGGRGESGGRKTDRWVSSLTSERYIAVDQDLRKLPAPPKDFRKHYNCTFIHIVQFLFELQTHSYHLWSLDAVKV